MLRGRTFTDEEMQGSPSSVVIDENLARSYFGDVDPLGRKLAGLPVLGVVSTFRDFETLNPTHDTLFMPTPGLYFQAADLVVRTEGDPMLLSAAIRARLLPWTKT